MRHEKRKALRRIRTQMADQFGPDWRRHVERCVRSDRTADPGTVRFRAEFGRGVVADLVLCCRPEAVPAEPFDPFGG